MYIDIAVAGLAMTVEARNVHFGAFPTSLVKQDVSAAAWTWHELAGLGYRYISLGDCIVAFWRHVTAIREGSRP